MWKLAPLVLCLALPLSAQAQEREGKRLFKRGQQLMEKAKQTNDPQLLAQACESFTKSYEAEQALSPLVNLARCEEARGRQRAAMKAWQQVADRARADGDSSTLLLAQGAATSIQQKLPVVVLRLPKEAESARLELDGELVRRDEPLAVDPGEHTVRATLGAKVEERVITTTEEVLDVRLFVVAEPAKAPITQSQPALATAGWVLLGFGGASWIATAATSAVYLSRCDSPFDCVDNRFAQDGLAEANIAMWVAAPVLTAVGASLLIVAATGTNEAEESAGTPSVALDLGASLSGGFVRLTTQF